MRPLIIAILFVFAPAALAEGSLSSLLRIDPSSFGTQPDADARLSRRGISGDGSRVVFTSFADNLVAGGNGGTTQVYLADRAVGSLLQVSRAPDGSPGDAPSTGATISAGGTHVAFVSTASNLVPGDTVGTSDLFVFRVTDGTTTRFVLPVEFTGPPTRFARAPVLSGDGSTVLVGASIGTSPSSSTYALYAGDTTSGTLTNVTPPIVNDTPEYLLADFTLSADGSTAVFAFAYPIGHAPPRFGVYALPLAGGSPELITVDGAAQPVDTLVGKIETSADASKVAFLTASGAFVAGDTNGRDDVVVRNRTTGTNVLGSLLPGGVLGDSNAGVFALSADGTQVAFASDALNTPGGATGSAYLWLAGSGTTQWQSALQPEAFAFAADGATLAFDSPRSDLVTGDSNGWRDVFLRSLPGGSTVRASLATAGPFPAVPCCASDVAVSRSARRVGVAGIPLSAGVTSGFLLLDRDAGTLSPVALPASWSLYPKWLYTLDDAGRMATFYWDPPGIIDINPPPPPAQQPPLTFLLDGVTGLEVDIALLPGGGWASGEAFGTRVSANGRHAVFQSNATDLVPGGNPQYYWQVYRRDLTTGELRLVSGVAGAGGNGHSWVSAVSRDGRFVAFQSAASDLVAGDGNGFLDLFLWDAQSGAIERLSVEVQAGAQSNIGFRSVSICDNGSRVAWVTDADYLVPGDLFSEDAFVRDRAAATTTRLTELPEGTPANGIAVETALSADCSTVAFASSATNLGFATGGRVQAFARRFPSGPLQMLSADSRGVVGNRESYSLALSPDGNEALFVSRSSNWVLESGAATGNPNVFAKALRDDELYSNGFE